MNDVVSVDRDVSLFTAGNIEPHHPFLTYVLALLYSIWLCQQTPCTVACASAYCVCCVCVWCECVCVVCVCVCVVGDGGVWDWGGAGAFPYDSTLTV